LISLVIMFYLTSSVFNMFRTLIHPTHIETRTHDQYGDTIEKSQAPDDGCINVRNMLSIKEVK